MLVAEYLVYLLILTVSPVISSGVLISEMSIAFLASPREVNLIEICDLGKATSSTINFTLKALFLSNYFASA